MNPIVVLVALCSAAYGAWWVMLQMVYRNGWQAWSGAMVLDPKPSDQGRADVQSQKAHGDARLASESEVIAATSDAGARRSSVHDQEF
jgi:hypothetical protein